jgi:hypothetical protein
LVNPGVVSNMIMIVLSILTLTGWGEKTLRDGRLSPRTAGFALILYAVLSGCTLDGPGGARWNLGGVLFSALLMVWTLGAFRSWTHRLQYLLGVLTVASALIVMMTLVPLDPAFFILDADALYPLTALAITVLSVKRPFVALSIAWVGLMIACSVDPLIHSAFDLTATVFGGGEVRDMLAKACAGVLAVHGLYHTGAGFVLSALKSLRRERRQEGGPEHA